MKACVIYNEITGKFEFDRGIGTANPIVTELGTVAGALAHTGAETHTGVETHTGAETHSGGEVFTGAADFQGDGTSAPKGVVVSKVVAFSEQAGSTLTGTVVLPAGSHLLEIQFVCTVLAGGTSASLIIGDSFDNDGWLTATDLKATDLLVGEVYSIINSGTGAALPSSLLGKSPAYIVAATGRKGSVQAGNSGTYYGVADKVEAIITQGTPSTTGRYFMIVYFSRPDAIAAVVA